MTSHLPVLLRSKDSSGKTPKHWEGNGALVSHPWQLPLTSRMFCLLFRPEDIQTFIPSEFTAEVHVGKSHHLVCYVLAAPSNPSCQDSSSGFVKQV